MFRRNLYYKIKPLVPISVRRGVRRWFAVRKRANAGGVWPILPGSEQPPPGWQGWRGGKKFAFVLTHDVEGQFGVDKCRKLMEMEMKLGFRSSFNFIPEGDYRVSRELRDELTGNGFEVGVHDLHHDGKIFQSREGFARNAAQINRYLKDWGAVGFRAGFMLHKLDWLTDLEIQYDASTFDTDPFEPQPDGAGTIFPFWRKCANGQGYVELPYTLPQDSTLFLLFREPNLDIWLRKLDWIASHGGMALVNVHPDYMQFDGDSPKSGTFPADFYRRLLQYVRDRYGSTVWLARPKEIAAYVESARVRQPASKPVPSNGKTVWVDMDNTPHVPLFIPIIAELEKQGYRVVVTARDAFQVCQLAHKKGMVFRKIGRHSGKNKLRKGIGLMLRAAQLAPIVLREKPVLALSHGSRAQAIVSNLMGVPTLLMDDYEFSSYPAIMRPVWEMTPEVIPDSTLCCAPDKIKKYPGIKEDIYASSFKPDEKFLGTMNLDARNIIVVARPPATEAHYHNPEAEVLFARFMDRACGTDGVRIVLLPRNKQQGQALRASSPQWFANGNTIIPKEAVDGLDLIWHADLVISGGGTMNREAAALGVPVYSVFRGKIGAVDRWLEENGRLKMLETAGDVDKIALVHRPRTVPANLESQEALTTVVNHITDIIAWHTNGAKHSVTRAKSLETCH